MHAYTYIYIYTDTHTYDSLSLSFLSLLKLTLSLDSTPTGLRIQRCNLSAPDVNLKPPQAAAYVSCATSLRTGHIRRRFSSQRANSMQLACAVLVLARAPKAS